MVGLSQRIVQSPRSVRPKEILFGNIPVQWPYLLNEKLGQSPTIIAFMVTGGQKYLKLEMSLKDPDQCLSCCEECREQESI